MLELTPIKEDRCRGLIFRFRRTYYIGKNNEMCCSEKLVPLKKYSCDGSCYNNVNDHRCCIDAFYDDVKESLDSKAIFPKLGTLKNGVLYKIRFVPGGRDLESGYLDDWWWEWDEYLKTTHT